ncbi:MAG: extracellular solute-binding protein [Chloroflexota bacterium]|nr:MAG: extracellular solute-binding protein [Chloroflexota bacterium]
MNNFQRRFFFYLCSFFILAFILIACTPALGEPPAEEVPTNEAEVEQLPTVVSESETDTSIILPTAEPVLEELTAQISMWHSFSENEMESFTAIIENFHAANPKVEFDVLYVPPFDLENKFESAAQIGGGPCILFGESSWGPTLFDSSLIADISPIADNALLGTINPAALRSVQYLGAIIGLPMNLTGLVPFRNKDIIPEAPTTFDELVEFSQEGTAGDVVGAYLDYGLFFSAGHLYGLGGQLLDAEGNPAFNDEKGLEWVELLQRFKEAGPIENNNDNDVTQFVEGKAGIIIEDYWKSSILSDAIGLENLAIDPWPAPLSGYVQSQNLYLNVNSAGNELNACWKFMQYLLSEEAQTIFSDPSMAGFIPAVQGIELFDPQQKMVAETFLGGTEFPVIPEMSVYWDPVNSALIAAVEQGVDPADALQGAYDEVVNKLSELRGESPDS